MAATENMMVRESELSESSEVSGARGLGQRRQDEQDGHDEHDEQDEQDGLPPHLCHAAEPPWLHYAGLSRRLCRREKKVLI